MSLTHGSKYSNTEPRVRTAPTKAERKLERRIADYESSKLDPRAYHKPGSQNIY